VALKRSQVVLQLADALPKSPVLLYDLPLGNEETVTREDRLLKVLMNDG
jgi:hypothetical protein